MDSAHVIRSTGKVKFFNSQKGYGFIIPEAGDVEVFVHHTAIINNGGFRSLAEGELVEYDVVKGPKGWQAANVSGLEGRPVKGDVRVLRTSFRPSYGYKGPSHHGQQADNNGQHMYMSQSPLSPPPTPAHYLSMSPPNGSANPYSMTAITAGAYYTPHGWVTPFTNANIPGGMYGYPVSTPLSPPYSSEQVYAGGSANAYPSPTAPISAAPATQDTTTAGMEMMTQAVSPDEIETHQNGTEITPAEVHFTGKLTSATQATNGNGGKHRRPMTSQVVQPMYGNMVMMPNGYPGAKFAAVPVAGGGYTYMPMATSAGMPAAYAAVAAEGTHPTIAYMGPPNPNMYQQAYYHPQMIPQPYFPHYQSYVPQGHETSLAPQPVPVPVSVAAN
ncbi:cold-shock' DNA-binding domain-containing protein [Phlyctochytrium arcticum]|nr:cold-shock' DNA-binding domain-containing protein [Phlyctochytrium arcticum]